VRRRSASRTITTCYSDETATLCFDETGQLDSTLPDGAALYACIRSTCEKECFLGDPSLCGSGVWNPDDPDLSVCLADACCAEFMACTSEGSDIRPCLECLDSERGGPLCDDAIACSVASGCVGTAVCDSGLVHHDPDVAVCLSDRCCEAIRVCTSGGADVPGCLACLEGGGGELCDDAIACVTAFACGAF
jgi:hypothetical protein